MSKFDFRSHIKSYSKKSFLPAVCERDASVCDFISNFGPYNASTKGLASMRINISNFKNLIVILPFFVFLKKSVCDFISDLDQFMLAIVAYLRRLAHMAPIHGQNYGIRFMVKLTVFGRYLLNN